MQEIKTIIRGPYEPNDIHALWIDTSDIKLPLCKVHENGKWEVVGSAGGGGGETKEETTIPVDGFEPNVSYKLGVISNNTSFLMQDGPEGQANHYFWVFDTGDEAPEITWPDNIRLWENNQAPAIVANAHYSISVYDDVAMYEVIGPNSTPSGGIRVIRSTTNWLDPDIYDQYLSASDAAEAANICGVTEEELAAILDPDMPIPILLYLSGENEYEGEAHKVSGSGIVTVGGSSIGTEYEVIQAGAATNNVLQGGSGGGLAIALTITKSAYTYGEEYPYNIHATYYL